MAMIGLAICVFFLPAAKCVMCYEGSLWEDFGAWDVRTKLKTRECEAGCSFEERKKEGGIMVNLGCLSQQDPITPSGCKWQTTKIERYFGCMCFRDRCNLELALHRYSSAQSALLPQLSDAHSWNSDGEISNCLQKS
ncbi:hypothetical protein RB195_020954 [Necator americanus]|uniref:Protein quiver n=1 Tax=Necator americanus TaxID=51031 RepID=A0ABR1CMR9_NECAM